MDKIKIESYAGEWSGEVVGFSREITYGGPGRIKHWKVETKQEAELKIKVEDPLKLFLEMFKVMPIGIKASFDQYRFEGEAVVSGEYKYEHYPVDCPLECRNSPPRTQRFPPAAAKARIRFFTDTNEADVYLESRPSDYSTFGIGAFHGMKVTRREFEAIDFEYSREEDDEVCISIAVAGRLRRPERYLKIDYAADCSGRLSNPFTRSAVLTLGEKLGADRLLVTGADRTREVHETLLNEKPPKTDTKYEDCYHGEHKGHKAADVMYFRDRGKTAVKPGEVEAMAETMDKIGGIGTYNTFNHIDIRDRLSNGIPAKWRGSKNN